MLTGAISVRYIGTRPVPAPVNCSDFIYQHHVYWYATRSMLKLENVRYLSEYIVAWFASFRSTANYYRSHVIVIVRPAIIRPCHRVGQSDEVDVNVYESLRMQQHIDYERYRTFWFLVLFRFNKIVIQGTPDMAVDKESIGLSTFHIYYSKCNLLLHIFCLLCS